MGKKREIKVGIVDLIRKRDSYTLYTYDNEGNLLYKIRKYSYR